MHGKVKISIQKIKNTICDLIFLLKNDKWIKIKEEINKIISLDWKYALFSYFSSNTKSDFVLFLDFNIFLLRVKYYADLINSDLIEKIFFISKEVDTINKNRIFVVEYLVENKNLIMDILACNKKNLDNKEIYSGISYKASFYENILSYKFYSHFEQAIKNLWIKVFNDLFSYSKKPCKLEEKDIYSFFKKTEKKYFNYTIEEILDFISNKILQELKIIKGEK